MFDLDNLQDRAKLVILAQQATGGGPPAILNDGNTVAWFDAAESYIVKDGSDFVSQWTDRSGSTNHLLQAAGTNQPLWSTDGVLFDGVDNFMKCVAFTYNQPEQIYIVLKQVTWVNGDTISDGDTNTAGRFRQTSSTPNVSANAGSASTDNANLVLDTFAIIRILFNGASSELIINVTTPVTGNFGANNMAGFTIGSRGDGAGGYTNIQVKEIILRNIADTAESEGQIYNYLSNKYGIS